MVKKWTYPKILIDAFQFERIDGSVRIHFDFSIGNAFALQGHHHGSLGGLAPGNSLIPHLPKILGNFISKHFDNP